MEETKCLKPSGKRVTTYGDSASVQAVTRVNAEQALYEAFEVKHYLYTACFTFFKRGGNRYVRPTATVPHSDLYEDAAVKRIFRWCLAILIAPGY